MHPLLNLTIDGRPVLVPEGTTVLDAARSAGVRIPTLCHHPDLQVRANCRLCVVELSGRRGLVASCETLATEGMEVRTTSARVREARQDNLALILSDHPQDCLGCVRNQTCELQAVTHQLGAVSFAPVTRPEPEAVDRSSTSIVRDASKCILCRRCVEACHDLQSVGAIGPRRRGFATVIGPSHGRTMAASSCVNCGQCIAHCPVGALYEADATQAVWRALGDPDKVVIAQVAPAVRVALGEELGLPPGVSVESQLPGALRALGFAAAYDAVFTADLTIMEEGAELVDRVLHGGTLPMLTSCCPGWVTFAETFYPDLLEHLSSCKSPQQMLGALTKTYGAARAGVDPAQIVMVSIMPCTAKKHEAQRPEMNSSGFQDVDHVLTTRELGRMLREAGLDLAAMPASSFDDPLGKGTGAGLIFGATGGVMEAAVRSAHYLVTGTELESLDVTPVRGMAGLRAAEVALGDLRLKVAVTHSLAEARQLMEAIRRGEADYHFVEIMACPGGCAGGGGQPHTRGRATTRERIDTLYQGDAARPLRRSHQNPAVQELYATYLGQPLGHRSHELLHTHYQPRLVPELGPEPDLRVLAGPVLV